MKKTILFSFLLFSTWAVMAQNWDEIIKAVASDRASDDQFGISVSISGDYAIIGAYSEDNNSSGGEFLSNSGSAYIFHYNGTTWTQQQKIVASDRADEDRFGTSVSISGNFAIVGTYGEDEDSLGENAVYDAGSAYIFHRSGTVWTQQQKIVASDRGEYDYFGISVSISGNYAIVGANGECHDATGGDSLYNAGSAYIFYYNGTSWTQQEKIVASDRAGNDEFGYSVAISCDYVIVGAWLEDHDALGENFLSIAGSAYIFVRSGTSWTQQQKIVSSDRSTRDIFGYSVSISGDDAIIGAYQECHDALGGSYKSEAGSAYIFHRIGTIWTQEQKIVASDRAADDQFGFSVSIAGNYAIVGAWLEAHDAFGANPLHFAGSAYIFVRNGTTWTQQQKIVASDRAAEDRFSNAVSISEDFAIVGAVIEDEDASGGNKRIDAGSVYIFKNLIKQSLVVNDTIIHDLALTCFNAYDTVKVAENENPVVLESGSEGVFIAGKSIRFFPGFNAREGSYLNAYITTDGTFCDGFVDSPAINQPGEQILVEKSATIFESTQPGEKIVKIYPNPNNGKFTLELSNFEDKANVFVYSTIGGLVYQSTTKSNSFHEVELPNIKRGIYIVGITSGKEHFNERIIVK